MAFHGDNKLMAWDPAVVIMGLHSTGILTTLSRFWFINLRQPVLFL